MGWETPTSEMSHTHASPPSCEATAENSRSRTGSPSALNIRAAVSASSALIGRSVTGEQHTSTFDMCLC